VSSHFLPSVEDDSAISFRSGSSKVVKRRSVDPPRAACTVHAGIWVGLLGKRPYWRKGAGTS